MISLELQEEAKFLRQHLNDAEREVRRLIVGMDEPINSFFISLISGGHYLIQGTPGLAKTKMSEAFSRVCGLTAQRVQGNPGYTPDDITGQYLRGRGPLSRQMGGLVFVPGPIFAQIVIMDEINRLTPKTQAALIQCMEEYKVTTPYRETFNLPVPFIVIATQNPLEIGAGVYQLTDANTDRFLLMVTVDFLPIEQEIEVVRRGDKEPLISELAVALNESMIMRLRAIVADIYPSDSELFFRATSYGTRLCAATRPDAARPSLRMPSGKEMAFNEVVDAGVSVRSSKVLWRAARADAFLQGADVVTPTNVKRVAHRVLRHRIRLSSEAIAEDVTADIVISRLLDQVPEWEGDT